MSRFFLHKLGLGSEYETLVVLKNDPGCPELKVLGNLDVKFKNESVDRIMCSLGVTWLHDSTEHVPNEVVCEEFTSHFKVNDDMDSLNESGIRISTEKIESAPDKWKVAEFN